jgi:hypothetical protein
MLWLLPFTTTEIIFFGLLFAAIDDKVMSMVPCMVVAAETILRLFLFHRSRIKRVKQTKSRQYE